MYRRTTNSAMRALNNLAGDFSCERTVSGDHWYAVKTADDGEVIDFTMPQKSAGEAIRRLYEKIARQLSGA